MYTQDEMPDEIARLEAENAELTKWRIAFESLTPMGSEWVKDLLKCEAYVRERMIEGQKAKMHLVKAKRELAEAEAEVGRLRGLLAVFQRTLKTITSGGKARQDIPHGQMVYAREFICERTDAVLAEVTEALADTKGENKR